MKKRLVDSLLRFHRSPLGTITHHREDESPPNSRGVDNVRWFEFQGNDRLLLIPCEDGKGGVIDRKNATYKLLWERIA